MLRCVICVMIQYIALHYIMLHYITIYYIILQYITIYYSNIILYYIILYYIILYYIILYSHIYYIKTELRIASISYHDVTPTYLGVVAKPVSSVSCKQQLHSVLGTCL